MPLKKKSGGRKRGSSNGQTRQVTTRDSDDGLYLYENPVGPLHGIAQEGEWNLVIDALCNSMKIPDLSSRKGLKRIHKDFEAINAQLNFLYNAPGESYQLRGGVAAIWGKMSADIILLNKLFDDNLPDKLFALLKEADTRQLALQVIVAVTHHAGIEPRKAIALRTSDLLDVMKENPDDLKVAEQVTVAISHAIGAVIFLDTPPTRDEMRKVDPLAVLRATMESLKKPGASLYMTAHILGFLETATQYCRRQCEQVPAVATFLVACLHVSDITTRNEALGALVRLHRAKNKQAPSLHDPQHMQADITKQWPDKLMGIATDFGLDRCDTTVSLRTMEDYRKATAQAVSDRDLCALGRCLAQLALLTELSTLEGVCELQNIDAGEVEVINKSPPLETWTDVLPLCAKALRKTRNSADLDMADILDIEFHTICDYPRRIITAAEKAIKRNSNLAYAYHAIALWEDDAYEGLSAAKRGLKCTGTTPFVRNYLLGRAVKHAGAMGTDLICDAKREPTKVSEGIAFINSALEYARMFIAEAPPDDRNMQVVLDWYIVLNALAEGPELSKNLKELEEKARTADEFSEVILASLGKTDLSLTRDTIIAQHSSARDEWAHVISRFDALRSPVDGDPVEPQNTEDALERWLNNVQEDDEGHRPQHSCDGSRKAHTHNVELYCCSWCMKPSAILRRCGRCSRTRYCDTTCQKAHWKRHKMVCKMAGEVP